MKNKDELLKDVIKFLKCAKPANDKSRYLMDKLFVDLEDMDENIKSKAIDSVFSIAKVSLEGMKDDMQFEEIVRVNMKAMLDNIIFINKLC